jgi:hypothetical protein
LQSPATEKSKRIERVSERERSNIAKVIFILRMATS